MPGLTEETLRSRLLDYSFRERLLNLSSGPMGRTAVYSATWGERGVGDTTGITEETVASLLSTSGGDPRKASLLTNLRNLVIRNADKRLLMLVGIDNVRHIERRTLPSPTQLSVYTDLMARDSELITGTFVRRHDWASMTLLRAGHGFHPNMQPLPGSQDPTWEAVGRLGLVDVTIPFNMHGNPPSPQLALVDLGDLYPE